MASISALAANWAARNAWTLFATASSSPAVARILLKRELPHTYNPWLHVLTGTLRGLFSPKRRRLKVRERLLPTARNCPGCVTFERRTQCLLRMSGPSISKLFLIDPFSQGILQ